MAVRSSRVAQCSARRPPSTRNQCVCSALKKRPVGGITPFRRPRFVPSLRTLATTVSPSQANASGRHPKIGKLRQQPLRDLAQMLRPIHRPGLDPSERSDGMLDVGFGSEVVTRLEVALVEDVDPTPHEFDGHR